MTSHCAVERLFDNPLYERGLMQTFIHFAAERPIHPNPALFFLLFPETQGLVNLSRTARCRSQTCCERAAQDTSGLDGDPFSRPFEALYCPRLP